MGSRSEVRTNESINLLGIYRDGTGDLVDPDSAPVVYIYDSSVDDETREAEITAQTYASAVAGPLATTQHGTGFYGVIYTVPSGSAEEGGWYDVWVATIDGSVVSTEQSFTVVLPTAVTVFSQDLDANELVVLTFDSAIADTDGNTLGSDQTLYFLTELNPYYASVNMVRSCVGAAIDYIDDITLAIIIHMSSQKADFYKPIRVVKYADRLDQALTCWVLCDASLKAISLARETAGGPSDDGCKKVLGSFEIETSSSSSSATAALETIDRLAGYLEECREDWTAVVQAGGALAPGQSFPEQVAVRGLYHGDRRNGGRQWVDPMYAKYRQPVLNDKSYYWGTERLYQHHSPLKGDLGVNDYLTEDD